MFIGDDDAWERIIFADAITVYFCRRGKVSCWCAYHPVHCGACRRSPTTPYHAVSYHTIPCCIIPYHAEPYHTIQFQSATTHYYSMPFHAAAHQTVSFRTIPTYTILSQTIPKGSLLYITIYNATQDPPLIFFTAPPSLLAALLTVDNLWRCATTQNSAHKSWVQIKSCSR